MTNSSAQIIENYNYDAFGNQTTSNGTNSMRYCGEYFDDTTGLIYLRARWMDSSSGRFLTEDPIRDGNNWYVYCNQNPIKFVDENGLFPSLSGIGKAINNGLNKASNAVGSVMKWADKKTGGKISQAATATVTYMDNLIEEKPEVGTALDVFSGIGAGVTDMLTLGLFGVNEAAGLVEPAYYDETTFNGSRTVCCSFKAKQFCFFQLKRCNF